MKNSITNYFVFASLVFFTSCKNSSTEKTTSFKVWGNCEQCKTTIESSCNVDGITKKDWNVESKIITVTFDTAKINLNAIQELIAKSGYDNDGVNGDNTAYSQLVECCQYERKAK